MYDDEIFYLESSETTSTISTHICPLTEGMGQPQYLSTPELNGEHTPAKPNINPNGEGVTFNSTTCSISIELAPSITPIIEYLSIANVNITNVNQVYVTILASNGKIIKTINSPIGSTVVTGFPDTALSTKSTLVISFKTSDGKPPYNVTLSIIACFHPELSTTVVSTTPGYSTTQGIFKRSSLKFLQIFFDFFSYN
jgi:hypothetical protein